ncbi:MAG: MalY/PatB family protein [Boseongicola sp.]
MNFDFDTTLPLRGAHTSKYDNIERVFGSSDPDVIPMWVADMDFAAAPAIRAALQSEINRGYFGYFGNPAPMNDAVAGWYGRRHGWNVDPSWVRYTHGVVNGFGDVLAAFSEPGDGVIVFSPVYHAFYRQTKAMGREIVESRLKVENGRFEMDLEALAASLQGHEKILTFCTPHNPGGRLWSASEINQVVTFCAKHDLILISDEIHMDLTFPGAKFLPTAVAAPESVDRMVVLTATQKAFNIAGGETGIAIIPDAALRRKMDAVLQDREATPNRFGMVMLKAAFTECDDWIDAAQAYIAENFRIFADRMNALPGVSVMEMQSTYLTWVDFSGTGINDTDLLKRLVTDAKVAPSPGPHFGTGGSRHLRFNVALPRATLQEAIERIERAFSDLQ